MPNSLLLRQYLLSIFYCAVNVCAQVPVYFLRTIANDSARNAWVRGGGEIMQEKKNLWMRVQDYSDA